MTEVKDIFLRQANFNELAELVIGRGGGACEVIKLRPSQLRQIALDSTQMCLGSNTSPNMKSMNGKHAAGQSPARLRA